MIRRRKRRLGMAGRWRKVKNLGLRIRHLCRVFGPSSLPPIAKTPGLGNVLELFLLTPIAKPPGLGKVFKVVSITTSDTPTFDSSIC